ncbi:MAG: flagellar basal body-associated FliL family protein [Oscillospiraceae bacterium]|nr:flagellar basal body-associated FliL family protein [Oscillospiraceae bacterium]
MRGLKRLVALMCSAALMAALMAACGGDVEVKLFAYDPGEAFVTNFAEPDAKKMLKCAVMFEITDQKAVESLVERNYIIRDAVIKELSRLTTEDATVYKDLDALGVRLVEAVNAALGLPDPIFHGAYFSEFTVA